MTEKNKKQVTVALTDDLVERVDKAKPKLPAGLELTRSAIARWAMSIGLEQIEKGEAK